MPTQYPFSFLFMTNKPDVAMAAAQAGADHVLVDLEVHGKAQRQRGRNTIISGHTVDDVRAVREALTNSVNVMARVNPMNETTAAEVDACILAGAHTLMLPMYRTPQEVRRFVELVGGRAKVCLLLETGEALGSAGETVTIPGVDRIHVGLNDLHLSLGMPFMFLSLARGLIDRVAEVVRRAPTRIDFGFGGGALLDADHPISPRDVLREHARIGSHAAILSRTFHGDPRDAAELHRRVDLGAELRRIRAFLDETSRRTDAQMEADRVRIAGEIELVASRLAPEARGA